MKLKNLELPTSSLDLKDFLSYCEIYGNYKEYAKFYNNQIKERQNDLQNYGKKIVGEHFLKSESDWANVLSVKDFDNLLKTKIKVFYHKDNGTRTEQKVKEKLNLTEQYYLRDNLTNEFHNISIFLEEMVYSWEEIPAIDYILEHLKIDKFNIVINLSYSSHNSPAKFKNRDGSYYQNENVYTINLVDGSISFEDKSTSVIIPSKIPHNCFG